MNLPRLRVFLLIVRDSLGYCDPPFWPKFPRLRWLIGE